VNLLKNSISVDQAKDLVIILKDHPTLKSLCGNKGNETELDMSGKMDGAEDAIMLAAEVVDNRAMTSLNISDNNIGQSVQDPELMKEHGVTYQKATSGEMLYWDKDIKSLGEKYPAHCCRPLGVIALADAIKNMRAISSVNLLLNGISVDKAKDLASILKEHPILKSLCGNKGNETELNMSGKMQGAGDAIMLAPEIIDNGAISTFMFSGDDDEDSKPVTMETSMVEVGFGGKGLGVSGAIMVAAFLPKCT
jgi:hypothetical protein